MRLPGGFFLTDESSVRPSALSPLSFRVCPRCCLRRALPQAFSHFLGLMDAAAAQWQAGLRGPGVHSAPARPGCRTCGCLGFQCTCRKVGHTVTLACQDTLPASARSELDRALSPVKRSWLYYASFLPCFTTVSEPEVEICWVFYFFLPLLACQGQRALSCFMSFLRRRPSQQSVAAWSSVLLCAS